jgi:hypothetical protein
MEGNGEARSGVLDPVTISGNPLIDSYLRVEQPNYTISKFTDEIYKVCRFKRSDYEGVYHGSKGEEEQDGKLSQAFARAKSMVKQYGLCNEWQYFLTLTISGRKYDRYSLGVYINDLMQWIRDERKRYRERYGEGIEKLSVLLVPENHKDGAWHVHGLVNGIPEAEISDFIPGVHPQKLIDKGFKNWPSYADKFGFCSLGEVKDKIATVLYVCKYINKHIEALKEMRGKHLYFHSRPLKKAENVADVYGRYEELDSVLDWHGRFCSTGMVFDESWAFPLIWSEDEYDNNTKFDGKYAQLDLNNTVNTFDYSYIDPDGREGEQLKLW